jgi:hypothetical protein
MLKNELDGQLHEPMWFGSKDFYIAAFLYFFYTASWAMTCMK